MNFCQHIKLKKFYYVFFIWFCMLVLFILLLFFGKSTEQNEVIVWSDFIPTIIENGIRSFVLIFPSWIGTIFLAAFWICCTPEKQYLKKWKSIWERIPIILSSLPTFITGIFCIRIMHLDTLHDSNLGWAILCLSLFNFQYVYKRSCSKIKTLKQKTYILYARSLGLARSKIFKLYLLPGMIRDYLSILRELLPHLMWESVVIEYVFGYSALMQSALDALKYNSWSYFFLIFYLLVLCIILVELCFRWLENYLSPLE